MVKKLKAMADKQAATSTNGLFDSAIAGTVKDSAQQIWLAGLGAFSKAQEEGGKVFEALVKEGTSLQRKTQAVAEEKLGEVTTRMTGMASEVQAKAGQHWDKLETIFEERTAKALGKLGVPAATDLAALTARVDALAAQVAKLSKPIAAKPAAKANSVKAPFAKTAAARPVAAVKKAVAKKAPARRASA